MRWMERLTLGSYFSDDDSGILRILEESEWRGIGITQSLGWEHFEVHGGFSVFNSHQRLTCFSQLLSLISVSILHTTQG